MLQQDLPEVAEDGRALNTSLSVTDNSDGYGILMEQFMDRINEEISNQVQQLKAQSNEEVQQLHQEIQATRVTLEEMRTDLSEVADARHDQLTEALSGAIEAEVRKANGEISPVLKRVDLLESNLQARVRALISDGLEQSLNDMKGRFDKKVDCEAFTEVAQRITYLEDSFGQRGEELADHAEDKVTMVTRLECIEGLIDDSGGKHSQEIAVAMDSLKVFLEESLGKHEQEWKQASRQAHKQTRAQLDMMNESALNYAKDADVQLGNCWQLQRKLAEADEGIRRRLSALEESVNVQTGLVDDTKGRLDDLDSEIQEALRVRVAEQVGEWKQDVLAVVDERVTNIDSEVQMQLFEKANCSQVQQLASDVACTNSRLNQEYSHAHQRIDGIEVSVLRIEAAVATQAAVLG